MIKKEYPEEGEFVVCTVKDIKSYGAFVTFMNNTKEGLVHISNIHYSHVNNVSDILKPGDIIKVKFIGSDRGKIQLSMKGIKGNPVPKNTENSHHNNTYQKFSSYKEPITNTMPYKNISLTDVHNAISGTYFKKQTEQLRLISEKNENRKFKATHFPYVTFSGTFSKRNEKDLIKHSGLIAIDFDHLEDVETTKLQLLKDVHFPTELLFVSPNGNGLKWIISIDNFANRI